MRDSHDSLRDLFALVEQTRKPTNSSDSAQSKCSFAVNSPTIPERMLILFHQEFYEMVADYIISPSKFAGIHLLTITWKASEHVLCDKYESKVRYFLARVGGIVSVYDLLSVSQPYSSLTETRIAYQHQNHSKDGTESSSNLILDISRRMHRGFCSIFKKDSESPLIANISAEVELALEGIASENSGSLRAVRLFESIADEIFVALHHFRPLNAPKAIHQAGVERYCTDLSRVRFNTFLFTGGMDSLTAALVSTVRSFEEVFHTRPSVRPFSPDGDYLELAYLLDDYYNFGKKVCAEEGTVIILNLAPSAPRSTLNIKVVVDALEEIIALGKPVVIIMDVTIENLGESHVILNAVDRAIANNSEVACLLCKSLQKYATLGLAKASGGAVYSFTSDSTFSAAVLKSMTREAEALNWSRTPDAQLIAFLCEFCADDELKLLERAAANTKYVHNLWPSEDESDNFVANLPFILKSKNRARWVFNKQTLLLPTIATAIGLEDRDSFASNHSAFLTMPETVRFNIGQESEMRLFEMFQAPGKVLKLQKDKHPPEEIKIYVLSVLALEYLAAGDVRSAASHLRFGLHLYGPHELFSNPLRSLLKTDTRSLSRETVVELIEGFLGCLLLYGGLESWIEALVINHLPPYLAVKLLAKHGDKNLKIAPGFLSRVSVEACSLENRARALELLIGSGCLEVASAFFGNAGHLLPDTSEKAELRNRLKVALEAVKRRQAEEAKIRELARTNATKISELSTSAESLKQFCEFVACVNNDHVKTAGFSENLRKFLLELVEAKDSPVLRAMCQKQLILKCTNASTLASLLKIAWNQRQ